MIWGKRNKALKLHEVVKDVSYVEFRAFSYFIYKTVYQFSVIEHYFFCLSKLHLSRYNMCNFNSLYLTVFYLLNYSNLFY